MGAPAAATGVHVLQQRLQAIERVGVLGLTRVLRFELVPERMKPGTLVAWQQTEHSFSCRALPLLFGLVRSDVVGEGVAGINFHEVVDGDELEYATKVQVARCVLAQRERGQRKLPRVLGRILQTRIIDQRRPADDCFQRVGLDEKRHLPREPFVLHPGMISVLRVHRRR